MKRLLLLAALAGCSSAGTTAPMDFDANLHDPASFYKLPWPSDLRLDGNGAPDVAGFPGDRSLIAQMRTMIAETRGFPVVSAAYFRFDGAPASPDLKVPEPTAPAMARFFLVDVDPASPDRGKLVPVVATVPPMDDYTPANLLAVAPRPGFVLAPKRKYAYVVMKRLNDAAGRPLGQSPQLAQLAAGQTPSGALGGKAPALYAPLFDTLKTINVATADVAAATVFTTGDAAQTLGDISDGLAAKYAATIHDLALAPGGDGHDRFCYLAGKVTFPQFQAGTPPYNTGGLFDFSDGGLPKKQRDEDAPFVLTLPKNTGAMPAAGYPLLLYFHGSGSLSNEVVDRGKVLTPDATPTPGEGPAFVVAPLGLAAAGCAMPLNPERLPGATDLAYLNFNNPFAMRDTFRQGVIEQRLFIEALSKLAIDPATVAACTGLSLPQGATAYKLDVGANLVAMGNSMGGMYTNMISSTEPRIRAAFPSGAGGFWVYFLLDNPYRPDAASLLGSVYLGTDVPLSFVHPALHFAEAVLEPADPMIYMPRLGLRPLVGRPVRPVFEPVGKNDKYFPTTLFDAMALAFQNQEAGDVQWSTMQDALKLAALDGIVAYPVKNNRTSADGKTPYTSVVVQYSGDGEADPHSITFQLDALKYQYGCFFASFLKSGAATVPAAQPLGSPCP